MKLTFMTLGCPNWDLDTICRRGREYGYQGVDFRGYLDTIDITMLPQFTSQAAATLRQLNGAGLEVSAISSSIQVCTAEKGKDNLEEARRTIDAAQALHCSNVRIFGSGDLAKNTRQELVTTGRGCIESILALEGAHNLHWLFETHDLWVKASEVAFLLESIPDPAFGAIWDMGHTYRIGGEAPKDTFAALQGRVGYTHIKDAVYEPDHPQAMEDGWRYVNPGTGSLPLAESIGLLKSSGYDGWLQFEHEKRWHPNLPEPEEIFPVFARWARPLWGSSRGKA
jgi:sugar phosphate isomerase/epimerase